MISSQNPDYLTRLLNRLLLWFRINHPSPLVRHRGQILIGLSTVTIMIVVAHNLIYASTQPVRMILLSILLISTCFAGIMLAWSARVTQGASLYIAALLIRVYVPVDQPIDPAPDLVAQMVLVVIFAYATLGSRGAFIVGLLVSRAPSLLSLFVPSGAWASVTWLSSLLPLIAGMTFAWIGEPTSLVVTAQQKAIATIINNIQLIAPAFPIIQARLQRVRRSVEGMRSPLDPQDITAIEQLVQSAQAQIKATIQLIEMQHLANSITPQTFDPANMMHGLINRFDDYAFDSMVRLTYILDPHVASEVYQDAYRIREAASAILENALNHVGNGEVSVRLSPLGDSSCAIAIFNTGEGLSPDRVQEIREALQNGDQVPRPNHLTYGRGLALANHTMQRLGGSLTIESERNVGTRVVLVFPVMYDRNRTSPR